MRALHRELRAIHNVHQYLYDNHAEHPVIPDPISDLLRSPSYRRLSSHFRVERYLPFGI